MEEKEKENLEKEQQDMPNKPKNTISLTKYIITLIILILVIVFLFILNFSNEEGEETDSIRWTEITDDSTIETIIEEIEESGADIFENADVYMEGDFDIDTISNELILKLAWNAILSDIDDSVDYEEDGYFSDGIEITGVGDTGDEGTITITQEKMKEKISEIFGSEITYTDESFNNESHEYFWEYRNGVEEVTYSDGIYIAEYLQGGGAEIPEIEEYAYKVVEYEDNIEIYIKMYAKIYYDEITDEYAVSYYDGYDFTSDDETGLGEEIEISGDEISETELENIETTYKYTFAIDSQTGDYYLTGFCEVTE